MAVPTGTASLLDIQNEFGGSAPISLSEYYGAASGVPTSGTISINDFRGKSATRQLVMPAMVAWDINKADAFVATATAPGSTDISYTTVGKNDFWSVAPSVEIIGGGTTLFSTPTTISFITSNSSFQPTGGPNTVLKFSLKSPQGATLFSVVPTFVIHANNAYGFTVPIAMNTYLRTRVNQNNQREGGYEFIWELPAL